MKKNNLFYYFILVFTFYTNTVFCQNVFSGEPVQIVGAFNGYSTSPYNSDYRTMSYRRLSTQTGFPTDGRGQWKSTISAQNSGGDISPVNMSGGPGNGFLFISGPSNNRFQNKWTFLNIGAATLGSINNITAFNSGQDMGINMINEGYYTFVFNDAGYTATNSKFVVSYTPTPPVNVTRTSDSFLDGKRVINITTSAIPSQAENIYVRYRNVNDFSSSASSLVQATGSGTNWTATIPQQACGSTIYYYIFTSNRTLTNLLIFSDPSFRTLSAINYDDNSGLNYSYTSLPSTSAVITGSNSICSGDTSNLNVAITGGSSPHSIVLTDGTNNFTVNNYLSGANIPVNPIINTDYSIVSITSSNGCIGTGNSGLAEIDIINNVYYLDADNDGFGNPSITITACFAPVGYVSNNTDCNDNNAAINPGATEICYNGIDDNCNGQLSESCPTVAVNMTSTTSTLTSFSNAVAAFSYSLSPYTNLKYRFIITKIQAGQPNEVQEFTNPTRHVIIPLSMRSYTATYTIRAAAVINDEILAYLGNTMTITPPPVALITLSPFSCGATLGSLNAPISAVSGLNATGYIFRIRKAIGTDSVTGPFFTSSSVTRFIGANTFTGLPLEYNGAYKVSVAYTYLDPSDNSTKTAAYGAECDLFTLSIPTINLVAPTCGTVQSPAAVSSMTATVAAAGAVGATGYQFRIRQTGGATYFTTAILPSRFTQLSLFGTALSFSTNYSISVQFYSPIDGVSTPSGYGSECHITTPVFPTTQLVQTQCGNSYTLTQQLNIVPYQFFPRYRVKLAQPDPQNPEGELVIATKDLDYSYFKMSDFPEVQVGETYFIEVAIEINGVFGDYGNPCEISVVAPSITKAVLVPFKAIAYPNPFADNFMLDVKTTSQSIVNVKVYDMVGRIIEQIELRTSDLETTSIGNNYPSGVYNVVVAQEDNLQTVRVVKR